MIRDALPGDWPAIWPIFEEIVRAGDAYAYSADTDKPTAEALWMTKPDRTLVFEHDGNILGTYYLKTNQEGPGKHVCNCGYMVSSVARGMGIARQMCEHSQGIAVALGFNAMQFNFVASSNDVAVALWKKLGFDVVGTLPRAFNHPTLGLVDAFVMYKWLTD
jgi:L-amino acid N-acyltransferase YncA